MFVNSSPPAEAAIVRPAGPVKLRKVAVSSIWLLPWAMMLLSDVVPFVA